MHRRTWQKFEQRVAAFFGCGRKGPMQDTDSTDIEHEFIHCQCKHSKRHAVISVWDRAKKIADKDGKTPCVALGVQGRRGFWILCHKDDLVTLARNHTDVIGGKL